MTPWTDEAVDLLKKLLVDGLSFSQIGARLGRSRNAVIGKAHREGLSGTAEYKKCHKPARPGGRVPKAKKKPKPWAQFERKSAAVFASEPFIPGPELVIPLNERKGILDLQENDCRWPIGDPQKADFHFCNGKKVPGLAYCEHHSRRAYQPPEMRKRFIQPAWRNLTSVGDSTRAVDDLQSGSAPIDTREKQDA